MKTGAGAALPEVAVRNLQSRVRVDPRRVRDIVRAVAAGEKNTAGGEITACFVGDGRIRALNRDFHGRDEATDVLAFDVGNPGEFLADIVISTDTAAANAARFGTVPQYESYLYLIHGTLHLLGYEDSTPRQRAVMRKKEKEYLKKLKVA